MRKITKRHGQMIAMFAKWSEDTAHLSLLAKVAEHPNREKLLILLRRDLKSSLRDLLELLRSDKYRLWYHKIGMVLTGLTGENPEGSRSWNTDEEIRRAWITFITEYNAKGEL